tara:strand:+ start:59 stop:364 length:306 start_codon:yes stop_codon:yes gene_type:complete
MPEPQLLLLLLPMLMQLLLLVLILPLEPELEPIIQLVALLPRRQLQLMAQQPEQLLLLVVEFPIVEPERLLVHQEQRLLVMALPHLKAFDWSKRVVLDSNH